jgi:hypothetical protein
MQTREEETVLCRICGIQVPTQFEIHHGKSHKKGRSWWINNNQVVEKMRTIEKKRKIKKFVTVPAHWKLEHLYTLFPEFRELAYEATPLIPESSQIFQLPAD